MRRSTASRPAKQDLYRLIFVSSQISVGDKNNNPRASTAIKLGLQAVLRKIFCKIHSRFGEIYPKFVKIYPTSSVIYFRSNEIYPQIRQDLS
ncbi:hypothetical protein LINGRAHAP2_LOCUS14860 [Linum grandiflorum]